MKDTRRRIAEEGAATTPSRTSAWSAATSATSRLSQARSTSASPIRRGKAGSLTTTWRTWPGSLPTPSSRAVCLSFTPRCTTSTA